MDPQFHFVLVQEGVPRMDVFHCVGLVGAAKRLKIVKEMTDQLCDNHICVLE